MRKGIVLPVLVVSACLLLAACGGSSSGSKGSPGVTVVRTSPATKASFDAQVGSLCNRANDAFGTAKSERAKISVISHYLVVFKSVQVPSELKQLYAKYLAVLAQELAALKSGDSAKLFTLAHNQARPLAQQLGATGCVT